jgi:hypothetical protein
MPRNTETQVSVDQIEEAREKLRHWDPAVRKAARITVGEPDESGREVGDQYGLRGAPMPRPRCGCPRPWPQADEKGSVTCLKCSRDIVRAS